MKTHQEKLINVYERICQLNHYWNASGVDPSDFPLSVENFRRAAQELWKVNIEIREVRMSGSHVRGMILRYKSGDIVIAIRRGLSEATKRATAIKELCHVILDDEGDWSLDGVDTIGHLLARKSLAAEPKEDERAIRSERWAEHAAREFLYPIEMRRPELAKVLDGETTIVALADKYGIPDYQIERSLSATEIEFSEHCWKLWKDHSEAAASQLR